MRGSLSVPAAVTSSLETLFSLSLFESPNLWWYVLVNVGFFLVVVIVHFRVFSKPPPVPLKKLPRRPALSIQFKPDDITNSTQDKDDAQSAASTCHSPLNDIMRRTASTMLRSSISLSAEGDADVLDQVHDVIQNISLDNPSESPTSPQRPYSASSSVKSYEDLLKDADDTAKAFSKRSFDLPDSFAPLLSSSQTEMLLHHLTADLIHGFRLEASLKMRPGRHEVPLDKDSSRPQFTIEIPKDGIKVSAIANVGSDGFTSQQDLDVSIPTPSRSQPMVKDATLTFDPPVPLANVAPTLIHIPTLFEDNTVVPRLRNLQLVRFIVDAAIAISSLIEKVLWIIESFLHIHLGKVQITPVYKGRSSVDDQSPEWRLSLAFSGHVVLFGWIPIPFISVILPTFVIPQPHALLEFLLSKQPLASARIRRENIAEEKIAVAFLDTVENWTANAELVATPPAVGIDLTLSGGVSLGMELMHGRDPIAGRTRQDPGEGSYLGTHDHATRAATISGNSMSSWTTTDNNTNDFPSRMHRGMTTATPFDSNKLVPWKLHVVAKGAMDKEKLTFHLVDCALHHEDSSTLLPTRSQLKTRGSFAVWKANLQADAGASRGYGIRKNTSFAHRAALASVTETPSVASMLLFPDDSELFHQGYRMLQYDYAFDVSEDSKIDAVTMSVGANHPMLNGGSMVTMILESIYANGSVTARQHAVLDPLERRQKRNILRHLPAIDFTFGIQNSYIPPESQSYTDDGQTKTLPQMDGGRIMVRLLGGIQEDAEDEPTTGLKIDESDSEKEAPVSEGIKVVADFGFSSIVLNSETTVKEFPELDIFEGTKLRALTSAKVSGSVQCHLRPQLMKNRSNMTLFNPLEAYEIDCSGSTFTVKIRESTTSLGHRRVIIPAETVVKVKVLQSVVDMAMEGESQCELRWDFQGLSPILQVTDVGYSPESVVHEKKEQVSLLIAPLRQGRLNFHVSPVGGVTITKAATSREDKEGLFDWKFFNAIVSPDEHSAERLIDVIHDKRTMHKLLQVIKLVNSECHRVAEYVVNQVWRAKEILEKEGVSDARDIVPGHRMARLLSLLLCDNLSEVSVILPVLRRVFAGDGLDVAAIKELLRKYCDFYDKWAPELDRALRWGETMFQPFSVPPPYVENNVTPLALQEQHSSKFKGIPSAAEIYEEMHDRPHLPLDPKFSNLVARLAPHMSFHQTEYFMKVRPAKDWQPIDIKRLRYVYSVKRKVLDIAESYGGLSFLPQSFLVSVFLGEATRASLRVTNLARRKSKQMRTRFGVNCSNGPSTLSSLRQRRTRIRDPTLEAVHEGSGEGIQLTAAGKVASLGNFGHHARLNVTPSGTKSISPTAQRPDVPDHYELSDCLLGPSDVAILLQAGLTSVMKSSSVVQLNQRMLFDLIASQPKSFAIAVLAEIGSPGGQGSPRQLTSALMALLELDQDTFRPVHRLHMHMLLESWLPGLKVPKREDYMAGGRWARQSYYDAIFSLANNILEDATNYMALKSHVQRVRHHHETDHIPMPRNASLSDNLGNMTDIRQTNKLTEAIEAAQDKIAEADRLGNDIIGQLIKNEVKAKQSPVFNRAINAYKDAFELCAKARDIEKLIFHTEWYGSFYSRNYNALMIKSLFDNVMEDVDQVRYWLHCLLRGAKFGAPRRDDDHLINEDKSTPFRLLGLFLPPETGAVKGDPEHMFGVNKIFLQPERYKEQEIIDAIIEAIIFEASARESLKRDPLVRMLISNEPGKYDFTIVAAMGVITEGKAGTELEAAFQRLERSRGVKTIRADTATARSFEYNAGKIIEAIESARELDVPYGLLGYSQGCANALMAETTLLSGTPEQQRAILDSNGLVTRQLLFSAANASVHGAAMDTKVQRLIVMVEEFFKYQQGYFSRALQSSFLEIITSGLDSAQFHKFMGGAQSFLSDGCRAFWREAQHLAHVPTCTLRGVLEEHTTPEALEMVTNMLTKQSGSPLHDSQVHVYDAVGHPVYHNNRNGRILEKCDVGQASIQRTHHWSPLREEVDFVATPRDVQMACFECAKDRHIVPWADVNARFGFIKYTKEDITESD